MNNFLGFPKNLIAAVVCQTDKAALKPEDELKAANIMNGYLLCSFCRRRYEIKDGILDLLAEQAGLDDILKSEIKARDGDAAGYNKRLAARYYKEVWPTIKSLGNLKEKKLIEYGCGTGRFTVEIEKDCQEILAIDFSRQSLLRLALSLKNNKTGLVLADATQLRTKENYFDLALATQFFEHIPLDRQKENFLHQARQTLKSAGEIICTVYHNDWRRRLKKLPKEGFHSGKIYYRYFTRNELKAVFKKYFKIKKIQPIDITLPLETRLKLPERLGGIISRLSQPLFPLNRLGHLLLIKASHEVCKGLSPNAIFGINSHILVNFLKNLFANISHIASNIFLKIFSKSENFCSKEHSATVPIKTAEQIKSYRLPGIFFKKYWFWFKEPVDLAGADMVNFFSYDDCPRTDFHKKAGLTTVIDLRPTLEQIWLKMRRGFIRQQINKGERNGIIVRQDNNFKKFKRIYLNFRKKKKLPGDRFLVFEKNGLEFSAYWNNKMIAGGIFIAGSGCIRALVLASLRLEGFDGRRREIIGQANRLLIWQAIKYAKENNFKIFDLGGINPDSADQGEKSLSEFKEAFGGARRKTYYYFKVYSRSLKFLMRLKGYKDL